RLHEDSEIEEFYLCVWQREHISEILVKKDRTIWLGKVKSLSLDFYAISILPKLKLHEDNVMEEFDLYVWGREHISEILVKKDNSIWLGKVKSLRLGGCKVNLLPKLRLHEDSEIEEFYLSTESGGDVSGILGAGNSSIWLGKVKKSLKLYGYAASTLPKLKLHEDNETEELWLDAKKEECVSSILSAGDRS
ncbi:MAG: uncharacterized protein A8A55_3505, partial [Amphiamblys sp. WSBS2006]